MLDVLVVGCGSIGSRHVGNLAQFDEVTVSAHDIDAERVESVGNEYGVATWTDLDRALAEELDCVVVCTPPNTHLEIATAALDAGAHAFVEKPLSDGVSGLDEFVDRAGKSDRTVYVACNMRFHPPVQRIQEWVDAGEIGPVQFLRLRYGNDLRNWRDTDYRESYSGSEESGGGIILDAVHEIDLALEWMDGVESVRCAAKKLSSLDIDVEDTAEIILESPTMMAELHMDYIRPERVRTYELIGREGVIRWVGRGKDPESSIVSHYDRDSGTWHSEEFELTLNEQYIEEMRHFLDCVRGDAEPPVDARAGGDIVEMALAAKQSAGGGTAQYSPLDDS